MALTFSLFKFNWSFFLWRFLGITVQKGRPRVGAWTGTFKNPTKCIWRWDPDRGYNFFFSAHLCRHIYNWNIVACEVIHQYTHTHSFTNLKLPYWTDTTHDSRSGLTLLCHSARLRMKNCIKLVFQLRNFVKSKTVANDLCESV